MSQVIKNISNSIGTASAFGILNIALATVVSLGSKHINQITLQDIRNWGSRLVNQIPTEDIKTGAIVGANFSIAYPTLVVLLGVFLGDHLEDYFESADKAEICILVASYGIAFLIVTASTPQIASLFGREISHSAAATYSLINILFNRILACTITNRCGKYIL